MRLNISGLIMLGILLLPNVMYYKMEKEDKPVKQNILLLILEIVGRIVSMFFMVTVFKDYEYRSFVIFLNVSVLLAYLICWDLYYRRESYLIKMLLAILPCIIFILSGISQDNIYLVISGLIFGIGHITLTHINAKQGGIKNE